MDTAATKAVVGFAHGETCRLGNVTIKPECRYAAIYVTAAEPDRDLSDSDRILIVAIARARNTGMKVFAENRIIARGEAPIVMEPVKATIAIRRPGNPQVHILDHSGRRTGKTLSAAGGVIGLTVSATRRVTTWCPTSKRWNPPPAADMIGLGINADLRRTGGLVRFYRVPIR